MTHELEKLQRKGTKPAPASIECQSEIDKDLVRSYYGDIEAFDRVRAALAATPAVGGEPNGVLVDACMRLQAFLDTFGDVGGCETQADLNDWLAAAPPASPLRRITDEMVNAAAREMWNDRDARHGGGWDTRDPREVCVIQTKATARAALVAALSASPPEQPVSPLRGREEIARIIDPTAFVMRPVAYGLKTEQEMLDQTMVGVIRRMALQKADAILALASPPEQPAAVKMYPMNLAPKDKEIIGQDTDGRVFNLRWDPDDCGENWYDLHGDQMAHPVRWMPMP